MYPAVITVGRFNPPTLGHAVLVKKLVDESVRAGASPILFIVDGEQSGKDKNKNPLTGLQREYYIKKLFPGIKVDIVPSAYHVLEVLEAQGLEPFRWIAGSDRAAKYRKLLASEQLSGEVIEVDREAGEADGVSATAARNAAVAGDLDTFKSLMPKDAAIELLAEMMEMIREETHGKPSNNRSGGNCVS